MWKEPEASRFFRKLNYQSVYSNVDVSEYHIQMYLHNLEDKIVWDYPFERLKKVMGKDWNKDEINKKNTEAAKKMVDKVNK